MANNDSKYIMIPGQVEGIYRGIARGGGGGGGFFWWMYFFSKKQS